MFLLVFCLLQYPNFQYNANFPRHAIPAFICSMQELFFFFVYYLSIVQLLLLFHLNRYAISCSLFFILYWWLACLLDCLKINVVRSLFGNWTFTQISLCLVLRHRSVHHRLRLSCAVIWHSRYCCSSGRLNTPHIRLNHAICCS